MPSSRRRSTSFVESTSCPRFFPHTRFPCPKSGPSMSRLQSSTLFRLPTWPSPTRGVSQRIGRLAPFFGSKIDGPLQRCHQIPFFHLGFSFIDAMDITFRSDSPTHYHIFFLLFGCRFVYCGHSVGHCGVKIIGSKTRHVEHSQRARSRWLL